MQPWHLTFVARGRRTLFADPAALTRAVRTLARVGAGRLLTFCIVDDHAHVVLNVVTEPSTVAIDPNEFKKAGGGVWRAVTLDGDPARVVRGGSWFLKCRYARGAYRR